MDGSEAPDSGVAFADFWQGYLPELEFSLGNIASGLTKLDELTAYYENEPPLSDIAHTNLGRTVVIPFNPRGNWVSEIKSASLFADRIICDDPLLYAKDEYHRFLDKSSRHFVSPHDEAVLSTLKRRYNDVWEVMPFVDSGLLRFYPFAGSSPALNRAIEQDVNKYLWKNVEVIEARLKSYPACVECRIPVMNYQANIEVSKSIARDFDLSAQESAAFELQDFMSIHSATAVAGLQTANQVSGTFWTGLDWLWHLSRQVVEDLSPNAKIYSFIHELTQPVLGRASATDLLTIRSYDDALYAFRREMLMTESLIESLPQDEDFSREVNRVFSEIYRPNIQIIERAMQKNSALKTLPWFASATGFAYAASMASHSPVPAAIFSAVSAAFGFQSLFTELADPEATVRREPAYIYWKLGTA